ncbi:MAG: amidohydrolase family protein [Chitinophagaceae bacterium]
MRIDSHVHLWTYDRERDTWITDEMKVLQRDFLPGDLSGEIRENGIDACITVQAGQTEKETLFLLEMSRRYPFIKGVVGWIDFRNPEVGTRLEYFSQFPVIRGWRHIVQDEPPDFLSGPDFRRGIRELTRFGYTYDLLVYQSQLGAALDFVRDFPDQPFVLDHCGKPGIREKNMDTWKPLIYEMAGCPNLTCKLSGLITEADWLHWEEGDIYPYLDVAFDAFGTDRLLFGSDWPVMQLAGNYSRWVRLLENYIGDPGSETGKKIFGQNAIDFYKL